MKHSERKDYAQIRTRLLLIRTFLPFGILSGLLGLTQSGILFGHASNPNAPFWDHTFRALLVVWSLSFIIGLPFKYIAGFRVEHQFGLSRETLWAWAKKAAKGEILSALLFFLVFGTLLFLRNEMPQAWWIIGSVLGILFSVVLGKLIPKLILPLFYKTEPFSNTALEKWLTETCQKIGVPKLTMMTFNLGKETRKANAAVVGTGKSRRMLLSDTLLQHFTDEEIKGVMAHELGHHKNRDLLSQLILSAIGTVVALFLTHTGLLTMTGSFGLSQTPAVQAIALILMLQCLSLVNGPIYNTISRVLERRADTFALNITQAPKALAGAFEKLAELNMADPSPSRLMEILFYDHPPIHKRIRHCLERVPS